MLEKETIRSDVENSPATVQHIFAHDWGYEIKIESPRAYPELMADLELPYMKESQTEAAGTFQIWLRIGTNATPVSRRNPTDQADFDFGNLTACQRDMLWLIAKTDGPSGVSIKAQLAEYNGRTVSHASIYGNLDELVDAGLVTKEPTDGRANAYYLTDAGYQALQNRQKWQTLGTIVSH